MFFEILNILSGLGVPVVEQISPQTEMGELIEDSIQFISLIVEIEQTFDIDIPDMYLQPEATHTIGDIVEVVERLCTEKDGK